MIVKILSNAITNITLSYLSKSYICYSPTMGIGSTFQLGSATIVPSSTDESTFINEVEVSLNDTVPPIIDDNGNVYIQVNFYKENLGITEPPRV